MAAKLRFDARAMSREKIDRCTFFLASASPLSCLILDQREWPDSSVAVVEKLRHLGHMNSVRGVKDRKPLENAAIAGNVKF